jgi:hypothetical protein
MGLGFYAQAISWAIGRIAIRPNVRERKKKSLSKVLGAGAFALLFAASMHPRRWIDADGKGARRH